MIQRRHRTPDHRGLFPCLLRAMIGAKLERLHRLLAQARAQALEQLRAGFAVPAGDGEEVALLGA